MSQADQIEAYLAGPGQLREAIAGMTPEQLDAVPIPGKWSTRQILCHLADVEPVYADRMKRVLAEDNPPLAALDPDRYATALAYESRDLAEELALIEVVRSQMGRILAALPPAAFQRTGQHSADGPLTLSQLFERITRHIPHHIAFIREKRQALGID